MPAKRPRRTSKGTIIEPQRDRRTSDVTKPVNSGKKLTWADHLRKIGAERPRQGDRGDTKRESVVKRMVRKLTAG